MNTITLFFGLSTLTWAIVAITVCSVTGQTFLTNGVVYYPFNGNASDASGNGNDGVAPAQCNLTFGHFASPVQQQVYGSMDDIRIYSRALSASELQQLYEYESGPRVTLMKAVKPMFNNLAVGTNYQLQVSGDLTTWTNQGSPFTATATSMVYPQYWDLDNWNALFFRLQISP